jgi:hypothetical protein
LRNELYVGELPPEGVDARSPGTNTRRPKKRAPEQLIRTEAPELCIVGDGRWRAVPARAAAVVRKNQGISGNQAAPGIRPQCPFCGLLVRTLCSTPC